MGGLSSTGLKGDGAVRGDGYACLYVGLFLRSVRGPILSVGPEFIYTQRQGTVRNRTTSREVELKVFRLPLIAHYETVRTRSAITPVVKLGAVFN
jgi:hypothetical protein